MKNLVIIIVCILLSGCGLFKKSKRIDKTLKSVEVSKETKSTLETEKNKVNRSKIEVKSNLQTNEKTKVYPTKGTEIKLNPDGSMTFQADSIIQDAKRNTHEAKNIVKDIISNLNKKKDSMENEGRKEVQKENHIIKESVPDKWAVFVNNLGWFIGAAILIIILAWWFFGFRKK
ncbi:hypothetical protein [Sphingobacterium cellulitidis]|uniref:hypothetical protein n=1 Tax=Sphingobacterium cellulitidis TaxID=1768011 RepID=UPI000B93CF0D|nr:hypothetical protein CHT99_15510 [Sphingobacterium cellulitidis]